MLYALNFAIETKRDLETLQEPEKFKAEFARWRPKMGENLSFTEIRQHNATCR
jgi:hypothetical protein